MERSRIFMAVVVALFATHAVVSAFSIVSTSHKNDMPAKFTVGVARISNRLRSASSLQVKGDPLRESTGIRPSLHPTTINAIADALKARAKKVDDMFFQATDTVQPLDVALTAGKIASSAIAKRQQTSEQDGMKLTAKEEQTIAGRVLGVIMRLNELESTLHERVSDVSWVQKYNEWATFGVLKTEEDPKDLDERIKDDPLFAVSRAECLLAIFLETVEVTQLEKVGEAVPDGSKIDFLDSDRMEVLLTSNAQ